MTINDDQKTKMGEALKKWTDFIHIVDPKLLALAMYKQQLEMADMIKEMYPNGLPENLSKMIEEYEEED